MLSRSRWRRSSGRRAVRARPIVFSGAPGSGKTTLLSCCAAELDPTLARRHRRGGLRGRRPGRQRREHADPARACRPARRRPAPARRRVPAHGARRRDRRRGPRPRGAPAAADAVSSGVNGLHHDPRRVGPPGADPAAVHLPARRHRQRAADVGAQRAGVASPSTSSCTASAPRTARVSPRSSRSRTSRPRGRRDAVHRHRGLPPQRSHDEPLELDRPDARRASSGPSPDVGHRHLGLARRREADAVTGARCSPCSAALGVYYLYTAVVFGWRGPRLRRTAAAARHPVARRAELDDWLVQAGLDDVDRRAVRCRRRRVVRSSAPSSATRCSAASSRRWCIGGLRRHRSRSPRTGYRRRRRRARAQEAWPRMIEEIRDPDRRSPGDRIPQALFEVGAGPRGAAAGLRGRPPRVAAHHRLRSHPRRAQGPARRPHRRRDLRDPAHRPPAGRHRPRPAPRRPSPRTVAPTPRAARTPSPARPVPASPAGSPRRAHRHGHSSACRSGRAGAAYQTGQRPGRSSSPPSRLVIGLLGLGRPHHARSPKSSGCSPNDPDAIDHTGPPMPRLAALPDREVVVTRSSPSPPSACSPAQRSLLSGSAGSGGRPPVRTPATLRRPAGWAAAARTGLFSADSFRDVIAPCRGRSAAAWPRSFGVSEELGVRLRAASTARSTRPSSAPARSGGRLAAPGAARASSRRPPPPAPSRCSSSSDADAGLPRRRAAAGRRVGSLAAPPVPRAPGRRRAARHAVVGRLLPRRCAASHRASAARAHRARPAPGDRSHPPGPQRDRGAARMGRGRWRRRPRSTRQRPRSQPRSGRPRHAHRRGGPRDPAATPTVA